MKVNRNGNKVTIQFDSVQGAKKIEAKYKGIESYGTRALSWCKRNRTVK